MAVQHGPSHVTCSLIQSVHSEHKRFETVWELKQGFANVVLSRAVRLLEHPLRELPLHYRLTQENVGIDCSCLCSSSEVGN